MASTMLLLWGKNDDGQLGSTCKSLSRGHLEDESAKVLTPLSPSTPTRLGAMRPATPPRGLARSAVVGSSSTDAFAWTASPCRALSGLAVLQVSCGSRHTLATVKGGEAYSWGWGACGQLGHGDDHSVGCPRVIEALKTGESDAALGPVSWVSAGGIHSAAVLECGRVFTWGGSSYGQLGLGPAVTTQGMQPLPGKVMLSETESPLGSPRASATGLTRHSSMTQKAAVLAMETAPKTELLAKTVVCGGMHTAALTAEGVVYCWGRADSGQLGIGAAWVHETSSGVMGVEWPRRVRGLLEGRRTESIACGGFHTAAVTTDGECYTWGKEDFGMLGCSNEALLKGGLFQPHRVTLQDMTDVSHAEKKALFTKLLAAINATSTMPAAPSSTTYENVSNPSKQGNGSGGGKKQKAKAVACGGWHTAVVGEKGGVWMCGRGEYGRLGLGDQKSQWHLTPVPLERGRIPASVPPSPRSVHGFGGTVESSAAVVPPSPPPVAKIGGGPAVRTTDPASMVALGGSHSLVMTSSGRVFGFGRQDDGRLGVEVDAEEVDSGSMLPLEISDLQLEGWRVQSISAGGVHSAAVLVRRPE